MPFLAGWDKRKEIRYGSVFPGSNLTDFPILIVISADSDIATELTSGGGITITGDDETTELPFGVYPSSDPTSGDLILRFKTDLLTGASTGDVIGYIYYDAGQTTVEDRAGVVSNNYVLFATFDEDPSASSPQMYDWVSESNLGTTAGSMTSGDLTTAIVGNGLDFDGTNDTVQFPAHDFSGTDPLSMSLWMKSSQALSANTNLLMTSENGSNNTYDKGIQGANNTGFAMFYAFDGGVKVASGNQNIFDNNWHRIEGTYDGTSLRLYINDALQGGPTACSSTFNFSVPTWGVAHQASGNNNYQGLIDEVTISSVARSADWIEYAYYNDLTPEDTTTLGPEETDSGTGTEATDAAVVLSPLVASGTLVAPTVLIGNVIGLSPLSASGALTTQTATVGNRVELSAVTANGTIVAPTANTTGDNQVVLTPITGNGVLVAPTVSHGNVVDTSPISANGAIVAPTITQSSPVSLDPITANGVITTQTVDNANQIVLDALSSRGAIVQPSLTLGNTISLSALTGRGVLPNLIVDNGGEEPEPPILGARYTLDFRDLTGTLSNTTTLSGTLNYR